MNIENRLLVKTESVKTALQQLNAIEGKRILFIIDENGKLVGTLSDGDVRRGMLKGYTMDQPVSDFMNKNFHYVTENGITLDKLDIFRRDQYTLVPVVNGAFEIMHIIDLEAKKSWLPIDVVIMAGGEGLRMRPFTEKTPKPLLKIGEKPILRHIVERLSVYGIRHVYISVRYLSDQIKEYFKNGEDYDLKISYIDELEPLGTIGALSKIENFVNDHIMVLNADLLSTIDFEDFYRDFLKKEADMSIAAIPYKINIPYGVLETEADKVLRLKEKPTYTYYSNAGMYLLKKEFTSLIRKDSFCNATDLMQNLIQKKRNVVSYELLNYWLDIGKIEDYEKAQNDIKHLKL